MKERIVGPIAKTLILTAAFVTFGCKRPVHEVGANMVEKPSLVQKKVEEAKGGESRPLEAVPVLREKKDAEGKNSEITEQKKVTHPGSDLPRKKPLPVGRIH